MVCIYCQSETLVFNSRLQKKLNQIWRRRRCTEGHVFTTQERADYGAVWRVKGRNGKLVPFSRDKLFLSLLESCKHRSTALADAGALADTVTSSLAAVSTSGLIPVSEIISRAQVALNRFDTAASVHYQAFHPHK